MQAGLYSEIASGARRGRIQLRNERCSRGCCAIEKVFLGVMRQRCTMYLMRTAASLASTRQKRAAVLAILYAVFAERDPDFVCEFYHLACRELGRFCPKAAGLLEGAEADALTFLDFPYVHHCRLRTNSVQELASHGIERRSRVVHVSPRKPQIRMLGAVLGKMDEGRAFRRRIIEVVVADNPIKARPLRRWIRIQARF